ncbi:MAG TPA: hypothetical protein VGR98_14405, partial [Streptosporangiaceae bacterium]|nr:hypothetical protein [Streptosporangiaceae bacterium]
MVRRITAACAALAALLFVSLPSAASATARAPSRAHSTDHPTQTFGVATLYGTSSPVPSAAPLAGPRSSLTHRDTGAAHVFARHASRTARRNAPALQPPSPPGTPVVGNPGAATGFAGLTHADQRLAGTGKYTNTQFSLEPPDQGLCVGNGFVVEPINDAFRVYDEQGHALTAVTALNQFYLRSPAIIRNTPPTPNVLGDFLSDPKCYFDPVGQRFIQTILEVDAPGNFNGKAPFNRTHVLIAVSQTSDPTGAWNLFSIDTSDDGLNGTPAHTGCPCLPDQPLLGANRDGVFVDVNEFQDNANFFFNGAQIFSLGRAALETSASRVGLVHLDVGPVPTGDANLPFWGSIQPATSLDPRHDTELFMTGGPEDVFQNNAVLDNRIAVWSLTGTRSLNGNDPDVTLHHVVLTSETYGLPINTGATQKSGPTPLRDILNAPPINDKDPLETINANDSRMNQVVDVNGILYGGVNTTVTSATGPARVGIAFFAVRAAGDGGFLFARIRHQGYVAVDNENVLFPSIAVNRDGEGAMAFTLSGPDFFPSAAYVRFAFGQPVGPIHVSGAGVLPEDGFSGYKAFGSPTPGVARWGDYSAAVAADGAIWMGNEFIPGTPRTVNAN